MSLTDLPDLHPDATGATINGVSYTREEYEALRARGKREAMPGPPDFDQIAHGLVMSLDDEAREQFDDDAFAARIAEQLRQAWNARGAADAKAVEERLATLTGWVTSEPYRQHLREAIAALDR